MRVHVHAAIWIDDHLVVHRSTQRSEAQISLPGGPVRERERIADALAREVDEKIGAEIEIGELLVAAEVHGSSHQDLVLVFAAALAPNVIPPMLELIDPSAPAAEQVLPPVVGLIAGTRPSPPGSALWLGNIYEGQQVSK